MTLVSIVVGLVLHSWVPRSIADLIARIAGASIVMIITPILLRLPDGLNLWVVIVALIVTRILNRLLYLWLLLVHLPWLLVLLLWILEFSRNGATEYILWLS